MKKSRILREVDYLVVFVPRVGYVWRIVEAGVELWTGTSQTPFFAWMDCGSKFEDFGLRIQDDSEQFRRNIA